MEKNKNCLTCGGNIEHKHKGAKYCGSHCYWNSKDPELKIKQRKAAEQGFVKHQKENGVWNKGETKETNETLRKMGENRLGDNNPFNIALSEGRCEVYNKGKTYEELWGKQRADEYKNSVREGVAKQYSDGRTIKTNTKPEREFKEILDSNDIKYKQSFFLDKKIYDFYLPEYNTLVEVDGVYWHGKGLDDNVLNETQLKNRKNDAIKNKIAKDNSYELIRIWGDEVKQFNINKIIKQ